MRGMKKLNIPSDKVKAKSTIVDIKEPDKESIALSKIADRIEAIANSINSKPDSFEFDIIRNNQGYIDKVYVKPIKH